MNANAMTPSWAIENATPLALAITPVAAAVPGPQITRAPVPRNSAATFRENDASALEAISRPQHPAADPQLLRRGPSAETLFGSAEQGFAELPPPRLRCQ